MLLTAQTAEITEDLAELEEKIQNNPNFLKEYFESNLPNLVDFGINILIAIIIFLIGKKIIKIILNIINRGFDRAGADVGVKKFVKSVVNVLLYIILAMIIAGRFGIQATSIIAILGSLGIAVGLALQDSMSNLAGGILLILLKPFKTGDYIVEQSSGNEGTVKEISLYYTKIITVDNKMVSIPNGNLVNSSIINVTDRGSRRLDITVGIGYQSNIKKAKEILNIIIVNDEARLQREEYNVFVSELADSAVVLGVRMWVNTENYWTAKWRITEEIKLKFDENHIEIPFNQLDVNLKNN